MTNMPLARPIQEDQSSLVVDVLCESFFDYPVPRFVLGEGDDYAERLRRLCTYFVKGNFIESGLILGVDGNNSLSGAAVASLPQSGEETPSAREAYANVFSELGAEAQHRFEAFGGVKSQFKVAEPHVFLDLIAVRPESQGQGVSSILMKAIHEYSARSPNSTGVKLTTEVEQNVSLYQHFGYQLIGEAEVASAFTTWVFFRPDPLTTGARSTEKVSQTGEDNERSA